MELKLDNKTNEEYGFKPITCFEKNKQSIFPKQKWKWKFRVNRFFLTLEFFDYFNKKCSKLSHSSALSIIVIQEHF